MPRRGPAFLGCPGTAFAPTLIMNVLQSLSYKAMR